MIGFLLLDKPEGMTSFSAVSRIKRIASEKRVGHTGTLDPMATGVLPVLLGRATALSPFLLDGNKSYFALIQLGLATDTDDITGNVISKKEYSVSGAELSEAVGSFTGKISQIPPIYSALKKDGVRLYKLAREGVACDIKPRDVEIFSAEITKPLDENGVFGIDVTVSKGTYIRSLARDIGESLGCGACLCGLRRTSAAGFDISRCVPLDTVMNGGISDYLLNCEDAVCHLESIEVTEKQAIRFCNGGQLSYERLNRNTAVFSDGQNFRIKHGGLFLGIGTADNTNGRIAVTAVINYPEGQER